MEFEAPVPSSTPTTTTAQDDKAGKPAPPPPPTTADAAAAAGVAALLAEEDAFFRAFLQATKAEASLLEQAVCFPAVGDDGGLGEEGRFTKVGPNLARVVEVYTPAFVSSSSAQPRHKPSQALQQRAVRVYGSVGCLACVHEKESDAEGMAALKEDFVRSLRDRAHILREEAATELEEGAGEGGGSSSSLLTHALHSPEGGVLRLPRRVLLPYDPASFSSMLVADYLLPGEEVEEAVGRVQESLALPAVAAVGAVICPELEAAVGGNGGGELARISSCNSLGMGRAPSTASLLAGHLDRAHSCASMASSSSLPRSGSVGGMGGWGDGGGGGAGQPVSMDAEEEEDGEWERGASRQVDVAAAEVVLLPPEEEGGKTPPVVSLTSSPQLLICMLVVGLAMVVGAALLQDPTHATAGGGGRR